MKILTQSLCFLFLAAALCAPLVAQESPGTLTQVINVKPKPGMTSQFEEGIKKHMAWHDSMNDTWTWHSYEVMSGPHTGEYLFVSPGHFWKDYDGRAAFEKKEAADLAKNVDPYYESAVSMFYRMHRDASNTPETAKVMPIVNVMHVVLHPHAAADFEAMMKKVHEATVEKNWGGPYIMYTLENGGESPEYAIVFPKEKFAELAAPEKPFPAMLEEAFGRHEAGEIMDTLMESIDSERTEILRFRADLSYIPESN